MASKGKHFRSWVKSQAVAFNFKREGKQNDTNPEVAEIHSSADSLTDRSGRGSVDDGDVDLKVEELHLRAESLAGKFKQGDGYNHMDDAIALDREALEFCPLGHPMRPESLYWLAYHLRVRYLKLGAIDDLREAVDFGREALALHPPGHPDRSLSLNELSVYVHDLYKKLGDIGTLNEAIIFGREDVALCPTGHPDRSRSLHNLATSLDDRYRELGNINDLQEAIGFEREALALRPSGHPNRSSSLNSLSMYVGDRYKELGNMDDLNEAIVLGRNALALRPTGHPGRSSSLKKLQGYLSTWSNKIAEIDDPKQLIGLRNEALVFRSLAGHLDDEIFRQNFDGAQIAVERDRCEALHSTGCVQVAAQVLEILKAFSESEVIPDWVTRVQKKCATMLEALGDVLFNCGNHGGAITQYSSVLSLGPLNTTDILLKRARAQATKGVWEEAVTDANEVIKLDSSSHRGYEMKYLVLHGARRYTEAVDAVSAMLPLIEQSPDEDVRDLRRNYASRQEAIAAIDSAIDSVVHLGPLVLIDLTTGQLCDTQERVRIFKSETPFQKLVLEALTKKVESTHISQTITKYFEWVMFSHTWQGREPTFKDVNSVESVWKLDQSPLNEKLRKFCATAHEHGHRWVWSDTCCIDRDTSAVLSQSLTSMYSWYAAATETLIYLSDVPPGSELGALTNSRWMTRAWTLQELLASKVVRFYDQTWKPYLNDMSTNHKQSPAIKEELAHAIGVAPEAITSFHPEDLGVREKLRLASTRSALVEEDVAYSLIGIFSSDIIPRYGLGKAALGQLLENIVARSGDVAVIAWAGESSLYNSALPSSISVYDKIPYTSSPMESDHLDRLVNQLKTQFPQRNALTLHDRVIQLPRAVFSNRCLHLPCIVFSVVKVGVQEIDSSHGHLYHASVSYLGKVKFRSAALMPLALPQKLVFVHPWLHNLRDPLDQLVWYDEPEDEFTSGSTEEVDTRFDFGSGEPSHGANDIPTSPLAAEPLARPDRYTQALRLIARLGRPFDALLLEQQPNGQYKRVATEHEIIVPGVSYKANFNNLRASVLEIV